MLDNVAQFQTVLLREDVQVDSVTVDPEEVSLLASRRRPRNETEESREKH